MRTKRTISDPLISVVVPVKNEEGNIEILFNKLREVFQNIEQKFEVLFINDGSCDNSELLLVQMAEKDKRVKIINFSKNFGHQTAVSAGLDYAAGDAVVIIDADMQDPPEVIEDLFKEWKKGFDVVNAKRKSRNEGFLKIMTAKLFYRILNLLLENQIPENVGDFRLLDKSAVRAIRKINEKERYLRGLTNWIGFEQTIITYDRDERYSGKTKYPFRAMLKLALNAIFSFSSFPLKIANIIAAIFLLLGVLFTGYVFYVFLNDQTIPGWTSQVLLFLAFSFIQLFVLGIISEYISRIYTQVQDRPLYIVANTINMQEENEATNS